MVPRRWHQKCRAGSGHRCKHFAALSTNAKLVAGFGIDTANMFGFWDWVGGRYSMDSAIGLSTMIAIGPQNFRDMLAGFHAMDVHFRTTPIAQNLPALLGLLTVWYTDFFDAQTVAVLPYEQYLKRFPAYLQQLTMESNGKHVTLSGEHVTYDTSPIFWGEPGTNGQHSFYQLIHQGTPSDPAATSSASPKNAQSARPPSRRAGWPTSLPRLKRSPSARPSPRSAPKASVKLSSPTRSSRATARNRTPSLADTCSTPAILGSLIALYEHAASLRKGVVWSIDSFDQWGVELGKVLAQKIVGEIESPTEPHLAHDTSTSNLIRRYRAQCTNR